MNINSYLLSVFAILGSLLGADGWGQEPIPPNAAPILRSIDFEKTILPIFEQHCFECHGQTETKGELRLDQELTVDQIGHTGSVILGESANDSELVRRITSTEEGYRMPKEHPPLWDTEIELIRNWIDQGAVWKSSGADVAVNPAEQNSDQTTIQRLGDGLNWVNGKLSKRRFGFFWPGVIAASALLLLAGFQFWLRDSWLEKLKISHHLLAWLLLLGVSFILYQRGWIGELTSDNDSLTQRLDQQTDRFKLKSDPSRLTVPPYPMHPKRLGGIYYRGNDERSPQLFNGGFYRTANLEVWLVKQDGTRLQWNDKIEDQATAIQFIIERAPGATRQLLNDRIIDSVYLRHYPGSMQTPTSDLKIPMKVVVPGEKWAANVALEVLFDENMTGNENRVDGLIYVFQGSPMADRLHNDKQGQEGQEGQGGQAGRVHFGIQYSIEVQSGAITPESELWMGSLYNLDGRVLIPDDDSILLDRWFDFRPIPEIEGENTDDPELLGIEN